ncbi:hypothetical protein V1264_009478 [Littorina saxatilis]|uniref:Uncharacterized protein n=1 Tax=Littorina saxatilis TaxID=31220 RepID=A0AAN9G2S4_9CAEN
MATYFTMLRLLTTVVIFAIAQAMSALTSEQPSPPTTTPSPPTTTPFITTTHRRLSDIPR